MKSLEEIGSLYAERRNVQAPELARLSEIASTYNGDLVVALPELRDGERPAVANLAQSAIDQTGRRIASLLPQPAFAPRRAGQAEANRAKKKGQVVKGWWHQNSQVRKLGRRARWLLAYGKAPVIITPYLKAGADPYPKWRVFSPLNTYPAPTADPDEFVPADVILSYVRGTAGLMREYPDAIAGLGRWEKTERLKVLEYIDADERVLMVCGDAKPTYTYDGDGWHHGAPYQQLFRIANLAQRPLCVLPTRPSLEEPMGQYDGMVGLYQMQAELMALQVHAVRRGVFTELWVYGNDPSRPPKIIKQANPYNGTVGEIRHGQIAQVNPQVGQWGPSTIDRIQEAARIDGAIPSEYGGLSGSNIRTGRRGAQVMGATIDFIIQEAQQTFEQSLMFEDEIAAAVMRAHTKTQISLYVPKIGEVTYSSEDLEDFSHDVSYAFAGADAENLSIAGLQRVSAETMSQESFMEIDPFVDDVEKEKDRITVEALNRAGLAALQQMVSEPGSPITPAQLARILREVKDNRREWYEVLDDIQQEAQAAQAAAAQNQLPLEEMQPGLAPAGAPGTPEQFATIPDAGASAGNLTEMLTQLRRPQMRIRGEEPVMPV